MPRPKLYSEEELRQRKNAKSRERYQANLEASRAKGREVASYYYSLNPEKFRERARKAREASPERSRAQNAKRRAADPDKARRDSREWFAKNPDKRVAYEAARKARKLAALGVVSDDIKATLMMLQRGRCACCRVDLSGVVVHLDHITPLSRGGRHEDRNLQLLCQPCNQSKHAKDPVEFMQERGFLL